ncbi:MAG: hypothetical protein R6U28_11420, partial [Cyclonatronaceae bacterium]
AGIGDEHAVDIETIPVVTGFAAFTPNPVTTGIVSMSTACSSPIPAIPASWNRKTEKNST